MESLNSWLSTDLPKLQDALIAESSERSDMDNQILEKLDEQFSELI